jgi:hypothetical protein
MDGLDKNVDEFGWKAWCICLGARHGRETLTFGQHSMRDGGGGGGSLLFRDVPARRRSGFYGEGKPHA